ncbi:MAG: hypothetical protein GYB50_26880 [Rhodobacteraceae bacterium]|nr:hypothetical protein [Paracoccaceae bacterium]
MVEVDLGKLTSATSKVLAGHQRGVAARAQYELDRLEEADQVIDILAPKHLETISPSFVQGFLGESIRRMGQARVRTKFNFGSLPQFLRDDFDIGIKRLTLRTNSKD